MMKEEIFGPVITVMVFRSQMWPDVLTTFQVYVYDDANYEQTLELINNTSPYALTGSTICATERKALLNTTNKLRNAAGNIYYNEKCTGAVWEACSAFDLALKVVTVMSCLLIVLRFVHQLQTDIQNLQVPTPGISELDITTPDQTFDITLIPITPLEVNRYGRNVRVYANCISSELAKY
ncbi:uncharacterized protein HD556DRAFT_1496918, partial [Suillus plorans]